MTHGEQGQHRRSIMLAAAVAGLAAGAVVVGIALLGHAAPSPTTGNGQATTTRAEHPSPRRTWKEQANAVCRLGQKLYPNLALGIGAEMDTMSYAVNRLVDEIGAIQQRAPRPGELWLTGRAAADRWQVLATRPPASVTIHEREDATALAARYIHALLARGGTACAALLPRTR